MSGEGRSAAGTGQPGSVPPGTVVGRRYRLDAVIGEGGMGVVHRATDQIMRRTVAIKQVRLPAGAGMAVAQARERVLREARAAGRVHHPGAVGVLDVIDDGELPWIVMELVEGEALSTLIERDGGLPAERVAQIGVSLAYALDAAHRLGVVHRDVKPSNVLVTADGQARLTDFGIAVSQGDPRLTRTGEVIGSPAYLSPERAQGDAGGPACDVWGLGGTLYAAVEGEPPFGGASPVDILTSVVDGLIRPPRHAGPLWPVLRTMLAQREADRPTLTVVRSRLRDIAGETSSRTGGTPLRTARTAASGPASARPAPTPAPTPGPAPLPAPPPLPATPAPPPLPATPTPVPPPAPAASATPAPPAAARPAERVEVEVEETVVAAAEAAPEREVEPTRILRDVEDAAEDEKDVVEDGAHDLRSEKGLEAGWGVEDTPAVVEEDMAATAVIVGGGAETSPADASPPPVLAPSVTSAESAEVTVLRGAPSASPPVAPPASKPLAGSLSTPATPGPMPAPTETVALGADAGVDPTTALGGHTVGTTALRGWATGTTVVDRSGTPTGRLDPSGLDMAAAATTTRAEAAAAGRSATAMRGGGEANGGAGRKSAPPRPATRLDAASGQARSRAERRVMIILVALILVLALALLLVRLSSSDDDRPASGAATVSASVASSEPSDAGTGTGNVTGNVTGIGTGIGTGVEAALASDPTPMVAPPGWVSYVDPAGWSMAYPAMWQRQLAVGGPGTVDFVDPGTGTFLRVGSVTVAPRSVLDDWLKNFEAAYRGDAQHYLDYQRVRLTPADGSDGAAEADLEFTYRTDRGKVHVLDRGASRGGHGYLLYWQTGEERWTVDQPLRQQMFASFRPAP